MRDASTFRFRSTTFRRRLRRSGAAMLLAAAVLAPSAPASAATCHPVLWVKETSFSAMQDMQRIWRATVEVDASRCATRSGTFWIRFVRAKENAMDLPFNERFAWRDGRNEIAVAFWFDEAVQDFAIVHVASCPCRP